MRLWHKDLISVLPRQQLVAQWRECCLIARNISMNGTPNHILVNKVLNFPIEHFYRYGCKVHNEMQKRGYKVDFKKFLKHSCFDKMSSEYGLDPLFETWHNDRYLRQCYYNLQEKCDCGGISLEEWNKINVFFNNRLRASTS